MELTRGSSKKSAIATGREVAVGVNQTGDDKPAVGVQNLCPGADEPGHVLVASHRENPAVLATQNSLRPRRGVVGGKHLAVPDNEIRLLCFAAKMGTFRATS